jgi:hypothetical protein
MYKKREIEASKMPVANPKISKKIRVIHSFPIILLLS